MERDTKNCSAKVKAWEKNSTAQKKSSLAKVKASRKTFNFNEKTFLRRKWNSKYRFVFSLLIRLLSNILLSDTDGFENLTWFLWISFITVGLNAHTISQKKNLQWEQKRLTILLFFVIEFILLLIGLFLQTSSIICAILTNYSSDSIPGKHKLKL